MELLRCSESNIENIRNLVNHFRHYLITSAQVSYIYAMDFNMSFSYHPPYVMGYTDVPRMRVGDGVLADMDIAYGWAFVACLPRDSMFRDKNGMTFLISPRLAWENFQEQLGKVTDAGYT